MECGWMAVAVGSLAVLGGCALGSTAPGTPAPAAFDRPVNLHPWSVSGPTPTERSIADALYLDAYGVDLTECPFYLATCVRTRGDVRTMHVRIKVDHVRCSPVANWRDQCSFRLTEREAGREVRSRCTGHFNVVGTSHTPMRWGVDYDHAGVDEPQPAVTCRRGRTERRAVL